MSGVRCEVGGLGGAVRAARPARFARPGAWERCGRCLFTFVCLDGGWGPGCKWERRQGGAPAAGGRSPPGRTTLCASYRVARMTGHPQCGGPSARGGAALCYTALPSENGEGPGGASRKWMARWGCGGWGRVIAYTRVGKRWGRCVVGGKSSSRGPGPTTRRRLKTACSPSAHRAGQPHKARRGFGGVPTCGSGCGDRLSLPSASLLTQWARARRRRPRQTRSPPPAPPPPTRPPPRPQTGPTNCPRGRPPGRPRCRPPHYATMVIGRIRRVRAGRRDGGKASLRQNKTRVNVRGNGRPGFSHEYFRRSL